MSRTTNGVMLCALALAACSEPLSTMRPAELEARVSSSITAQAATPMAECSIILGEIDLLHLAWSGMTVRKLEFTAPPGTDRSTVTLRRPTRHADEMYRVGELAPFLPNQVAFLGRNDSELYSTACVILN
jgi:hypothetical protein